MWETGGEGDEKDYGVYLNVRDLSFKLIEEI